METVRESLPPLNEAGVECLRFLSGGSWFLPGRLNCVELSEAVLLTRSLDNQLFHRVPSLSLGYSFAVLCRGLSLSGLSKEIVLGGQLFGAFCVTPTSEQH